MVCVLMFFLRTPNSEKIIISMSGLKILKQTEVKVISQYTIQNHWSSC